MKYKIAVSTIKLNKKLQHGDPRWNSFNSSFKNCSIEMTELLDVVYAGQAITTHHKDNWRVSKNYLCGQHLALDLDTEDERSTLKYLAKDKFITKHAAFIHTTISHTTDKPRARVVFVLDQPIMQAKNYSLAASALLWLYGSADPQCKDPARFFYGSPGCQFEYYSNTIQLDVIKKLIDNYLHTGKTEKKKADKQNYTTASQKDVSEALERINPWGIEYYEWVNVLMALHHEFGDAGYQMANSWASGYPGEVERKWKSFKKDGNVIGTVTLGTLFDIAKRFGWKHQDNVL
jgi:hypothetical protein